ncbi:MAG: hypothetical protein OEX13_20920 [Gammaproteobacteria bacterium]|nr:hypothetical protein [Gammaproteobacteria bacterium]
MLLQGRRLLGAVGFGFQLVEFCLEGLRLLFLLLDLGSGVLGLSGSILEVPLQ